MNSRQKQKKSLLEQEYEKRQKEIEFASALKKEYNYLTINYSKLEGFDKVIELMERAKIEIDEAKTEEDYLRIKCILSLAQEIEKKLKEVSTLKESKESKKIPPLELTEERLNHPVYKRIFPSPPYEVGDIVHHVNIASKKDFEGLHTWNEESELAIKGKRLRRKRIQFIREEYGHIKGLHKSVIVSIEKNGVEANKRLRLSDEEEQQLVNEGLLIPSDEIYLIKMRNWAIENQHVSDLKMLVTYNTWIIDNHNKISIKSNFK